MIAPPLASFYEVVLAIHISAIVIGFGITFTYGLILTVGARMDPRAVPWFHRVQRLVGRRIIQPSLAVVLIAGIYLASDADQWSQFYVGWGLLVVLVLGAMGGMFFMPRELRMAELAERDVAAAGASGEVVFSEEYQALSRTVAMGGMFADVLILLTILFMAIKP